MDSSFGLNSEKSDILALVCLCVYLSTVWFVKVILVRSSKESEMAHDGS